MSVTFGQPDAGWQRIGVGNTGTLQERGRDRPCEVLSGPDAAVRYRPRATDRSTIAGSPSATPEAWRPRTVAWSAVSHSPNVR